MKGTMKIKLNGSETRTDAQCLSDLVSEFVTGRGLDPEGLIAEYNYQVVRQDLWPDTRLNPGDVVELLSFVGGG